MVVEYIGVLQSSLIFVPLFLSPLCAASLLFFFLCNVGSLSMLFVALADLRSFSSTLAFLPLLNEESFLLYCDFFPIRILRTRFKVGYVRIQRSLFLEKL